MTPRIAFFPPRLRAVPLASAFWLASAAAAAGAAEPAPAGVMTLSASATVEVPRDWMTLVFAASREGADAGVVQGQLKQALEAALVEARRIARPGAVEMETGGFSIQPRYSSKGQVNGWQGSTELVVQGRDMAAIAQLSGKISSMSIARVGTSLSREARERVEAEVTAQAIARFRAMAAAQAQQFGYGGYTLREVNVSVDAGGGAPMPRMAMMARAGADEAALPVEAGKGTVSATVNGSVQLK